MHDAVKYTNKININILLYYVIIKIHPKYH